MRLITVSRLFVSVAPAISERISIRPPAHTVWENPIEEACYGAGKGRADVEYPEVSLFRVGPWLRQRLKTLDDAKTKTQ